jgi:VCBS repeat-containing protein
VWDNPAQTTLTTNGIIDFQDPDAHDPHHVQVLAAPGNWGQLNWHLSDTSDSGGHGQLQWDYLVNESVVRPLAAGESHADHLTFRIFDSTGNFVDKPVTVWDFGSDEPPIVQAPNPIVVNVSAGQPISTSGTFSFTDADRSDTHHVEFFGTGDGGFGNGQFSATLLHDTVNGSGGLVQWNFNLDPSGLQYLGAGETASATWVVNIVGNNDALVALGVPINGPGMSTTENVTFVVNGVNDLPYFRTAPVTLSETPFQASPGSAFGVHHSDNIGFGDPDMHDTHFVFAQFNAQQSNTPQLGHLAVSLQGDTTGGINVNGIVHYDYDYNSNVFNYADLPAYGNAHQVYDIVLQDNHGGQTVQSFTIDLHFPVPV